jgi:hypothetical protein
MTSGNGENIKDVFVVQGEVSESVPDPEKAIILTPQDDNIPRPTVFLNRLDILRQNRVPMTLPMYIDKVTQDRDLQDLVIPQDTVKELGLRFGDIATIDTKTFEILKVNGTNNWDLLRNRPHIEGVSALESDYPFVRWPLGYYSNDLLCWSLFAPVGRGQRLFIVSPPKGGKSWILWDIERAHLDMTLYYKKMYVIIVQVGERGEDANEMEKILKRVNHDPSRVEFYKAPDRDPSHSYWYIPMIATQRARRLAEMGYHVVLIMDSASRVFLGHSRSPLIPKEDDAMISKGGKVVSVDITKRDILSVAGDYTQVDEEGNITFEGSLTLYISMIGNMPRDPSSEKALADDTATSTSTGIWATRPSATGDHPMIDLAVTHVRRWERLCTPTQLRQRNEMIERMNAQGKRGRPEAWESLNRLHQFALENPRTGKPMIESTKDALKRIEEMGQVIVGGDLSPY